MFASIAILFSLLFLPQNSGRLEREDTLFSSIIKDSGKAFYMDFSLFRKDRGHIYILDGGSYLSESVRGDSYALMKRNSLEPLILPSFPEESVRTLFTNPSAAVGISINVVLHKYGYRTETATLMLADLMVTFINDGCKVYVGLESMDNDGVLVSVFIVNSEHGYCHVMKADVPMQILADRKGLISGDMHSFIPIDNVTDLFAK